MQEQKLMASESELRLRRAFATALQISEESVNESLQYASTPGWDSVVHLALIAALDSTFDVMLDTDDVLDLSSYAMARQILRKYGVQF